MVVCEAVATARLTFSRAIRSFSAFSGAAFSCAAFSCAAFYFATFSASPFSNLRKASSNPACSDSGTTCLTKSLNI